MEPTEWPKADCCLGAEGCVCPDMERALRGWIRGDNIPPMTGDQRESCLSEIGKVEGYSSTEHETETDSELARTTLSAWTDYCRDKGLHVTITDEMVELARTAYESNIEKPGDEPLRAALAAALAQSPTGVKALKWQAKTISEGAEYTITIVGTYFAYSDGGWTSPWGHHSRMEVADNTLEGAKAAAQADFEARVLSALSPPAQEPVAYGDIDALRDMPWDDMHPGIPVYPTPENGRGKPLQPLYTSPAQGQREGDDAIVKFDDGSEVALASFSGGNAEGGMFAELSLMKTLADGTTFFRRYKATSEWFNPDDLTFFPSHKEGGS